MTAPELRRINVTLRRNWRTTAYVAMVATALLVLRLLEVLGVI